MKLSNRARAIRPSPTMSVSAAAMKMKQQGIDVINFGVGEPDFPTPEYIKQSAIRAIEANFTHYTQAKGIPELREAIVQKMQRDNGLIYSPDQVLVSPGAKASILTVLMAVCDPRDEVFLPTPYWVSYPSQVEMVDAIPVYLPADESDDFKIRPEQLEQAIRAAANPKALILNSPNNPTGTVYTQKELEAIADICLRHDILIISDEIYEKLIYDDSRHFSIAVTSAEVQAITIVINGVSKAYAMTGWRLGYACGPQEIINSAARIQGHSSSCVNSITQKAVVDALSQDDGSVEKMRREFEQRRNFLVSELNKIPEIHCNLPRGAFYAMPNIRYYLENNQKGICNSIDLCEHLIKEYHIAVVPGIAFGTDAHIRFSYANSMENITEGLTRLKRGMANLLDR